MKLALRTFMTTAPILMVASFAFSQTPLPGSLAETMKGMSADIRQIAKQASDAKLNPSSAKLADDFARLAEHARGFVPDSVASLPAAQKPQRQALYQKMIDDTATSGHALADAFRANDNPKAATLIRQLADDRTQGHNEFK